MEKASRAHLKFSNLDSASRTTLGAGMSLSEAPPHLDRKEELDDEPSPEDLPPPGSVEEDQQFKLLQARLPQLWNSLVQDEHGEQTVVVVPSLSLDQEELAKLKGPQYYEERLLFMLILLTLPKTRMVFVTSQPIHPIIIDYYLQLLPGIPYSHARQRLKLFSTYDSSLQPLSQKILARPTLIRRIRQALDYAHNTYLNVFNVTPLEKRLSVALSIPLLGTDPEHLHFGTKSGARRIFEKAGIPHPPGFSDLADGTEIADAVVELFRQHRETRKVVIKLNDGFSGEGNAIYPLEDLRAAFGTEGKVDLRKARRLVRRTLPRRIRFQTRELTWERYLAKFEEMKGVVEAFIEGEGKASPSVQVRITPLREVQIVSTHDQILGGPDRQVFIGCHFPARAEFRPMLHRAAREIGQHLADAGVVERLSIDFLAVPCKEKGWRLYAVEINLRKGGTTHPFRTLQFLTAGRYNPDTGLFETSTGQHKYYMASDNLESESYRGLLPEDLIDITAYTGLHYSSTTHTGVVFHMIGALSEFGKVGLTCVGNSPEEAGQLYQRTLQVLDRASQTTRWLV